MWRLLDVKFAYGSSDGILAISRGMSIARDVRLGGAALRLSGGETETAVAVMRFWRGEKLSRWFCTYVGEFGKVSHSFFVIKSN